MSNYKLKPGLSSVFLPGAGKVTVKTVLTGEQYQRFVPQFLVEVLEEAVQAPAAPFAVVVPVPEPEPIVAPAAAPAPMVAPEAIVAPEPVPELVIAPEPAPEPAPESVIAPETVVPAAPVIEVAPEPVVVVPAPEVVQEVTPAPIAVLDSPEGATPAIVETSPSTPARPVEKKKKR